MRSSGKGSGAAGGGTLVVAAVQMRFAPEIAGNLAAMRTAVEAAARRKADVVLFPECALTGYNRDFGAIPRGDIESGLEEVGALARKHGCHVLVGSPTFRGRRRYNSLVAFDRRGRETHRYSKIHLTARDRKWFTPGNALAFFHVDGIACTAIICHERRFPELVRLPVMLGARIVFHPNAGLDALAVSRTKRGGRDGIVARAFENQVFYVFANSAGPQGDGLWSAGDSKIVAPGGEFLALANHFDEAVIHAKLNLAEAGRLYAREALEQPAFLRRHWRALLAVCRRQLRASPPRAR